MRCSTKVCIPAMMCGVRDNEKPHRIFKTSVYNGTVRRKTARDPVTGKWHYVCQLHDMARLYESCEVINPDNLGDYVSEERFIDIVAIGEKDYYDKGFAAMDKPPNQSVRNIVRN